jgi:MFS family permease
LNTTDSASAAVPRGNDVRVIGLVGFAHATSHFFHLLLPPLFPWLMPEFGLSFTAAGIIMTVFFVVSGVGQALAGFVVDRFGPRRVLLSGIACFILAALLLGAANGYPMLLAAGALAGLGNSVFHPADFTVLNRKVGTARLSHAFSVHGLSGNLGWALAPVFLAGIAAASSWRLAAFGAAGLGAAAWLVIWLQREATDLGEAAAKVGPARTATAFGFLGSAAVWLCFAFFLDGNANPLGDDAGSRFVGGRQENRELLAAVTGDPVAGTLDDARQGAGHAPQAFVAALVAVGVVVQLEVIDVDHEQGQGAGFPRGATPLHGQAVVKTAAVGHAGQAVAQGHAFELDLGHLLHRHVAQGFHHGDHLAVAVVDRAGVHGEVQARAYPRHDAPVFRLAPLGR